MSNLIFLGLMYTTAFKSFLYEQNVKKGEFSFEIQQSKVVVFFH